MAELLLGGGAGLGLALIGAGLNPPRPAMGALLQRLRQPPRPQPTGRDRLYAGLGAPLARLGLPRPSVQADLMLLQKDPAQHLAEQAAAVLLGAVAVPFAAVLFGIGGPVPVWTAALGAAAGWRWTDSNLHAQAERRRSELRHALSVLLTLLTISLARGAGVEQALSEASDITTGWAARRLRTVLDTAAALRQPPWVALAQLGTDTDTPAVADLAASLGLAASEGAHVQASLAARASAMRTAATTDMETAAEQASSRMVLPLLVLGASYLIFLLYPPMAALSSTL